MSPHHTRVSAASYLTLALALLFGGLLWFSIDASVTRAQDQPEALGSISGAVHNEQGDPLPNITVWLEQYQGLNAPRTVTTNDKGIYQFLSVPFGIYHLRFEDAQKQYATKYYTDADFAGDATAVNVSGNNVTGINMQLQPAGSISVTLQSAMHLTATAYSVSLFRQTASGGWSRYRQATPPLGENDVRFDALPTGNYRLCAEADRYNSSFYYYGNAVVECYDNVLPESIAQLAPAAANIQVQAGAETKIAIVFDDISQIQGYILAPNGHPQEGIIVALSQANNSSYPILLAETNEKGYFTFGYINSGSYYLTFNSPYFYGSNEYLPIYYPDELVPVRATNLIIDASTRISVTRRLTPVSRITGKVTLPGDVPVASAYVSVYRQSSDGSWTQPTDCTVVCPQSTYNPVTGAYTVTQLIGGHYRVRADYYANNYQFYSSEFYGGDSFESADDVVLRRAEDVADINFIVGEKGFDSSVAGVVTAEGKPLAGIEVGLFPPYVLSFDQPAMPLVTAMTDEQGHYQVEGLSAAAYGVGFRDPKGIYATTFYTGATLPYVVGSLWISGTTTLDTIALSPGATIRGHVRTQNGISPGGFSIQVVQQPNNTSFSISFPYILTRTSADGAFEVTGLPPGTYYLRADTPSGSGDFPTAFFLYYPGKSDIFLAQPLTVEAGQTLEKRDFFFFFTPTNFLPIIRDNSHTPQSGETATPLPPFTPAPPVPTPTPVAIP
jgi:hypothetical protein